MRSVAFLAAVCSIVVSEIQIGQLLDNTSTCQKLCHTQKTKAKVPSILLKKALRGCCDEATTCVLPGHFYNVSCVKELLNVCNSENQSAPNLTKTQHLCCGNFSNETGREFKAPRKCFRNISVNWTDAMFWRVRNRNLKPIFKWKRKHWEFFLKMVTQACLNSTEKTSSGLTPSSVAIKFTYPTFAKRENYEKTFVRAVYAPASYLVMRKGDHDMLSILGESVKHLWVTLCICITWTVISGVIIWLLDRRSNPLQFPSCFWQGVCEGTWWAVATMTTVGYGDRSPRSLLARMYAAVWMIIGMVTLSTFTADVSSVLTAREMMPRNSYLNRIIGVPLGSKKLFSKEFGGGTIKEMASLKDLENHLQTGEGVHRIVLHTCVADHDADSKQILEALKPHIVGIRMNVNTKSSEKRDNMVRCVRKKIDQHPDINPLIDDDDDDEFEFYEEEDCNIEMREHSQMKDSKHRDLTVIILYMSLGLLAAILIAGSVWNLTGSRKQDEKIEADVEARTSFGKNVTVEPIKICETLEEEHEREK